MTRPLRAVVVDDERLARLEMRTLLAAHSVEIVGEASGADAAEALLADLSVAPDVLFLDVQMPGRTGFDLLESLAAPPHVVFVTAYDQHALDAFRVSAVDYLLKPVEPVRLAQALGRVRTRLADEPADARPTPGADARLGAHDRVFVREAGRVFLVRVGDVRLFESEGNYTRLHFTGPDGRDARPLVLRSLSALEERIEARIVARASRSQMVGLAHVAGVDEEPGGGLRVRLAGGDAVSFSRRRAAALRERLSL